MNADQTRYLELLQERRNIDADYEQKQKLLEEKFRTHRRECRHKHTQYYPDAAGGSSSFWECQDCGREFRTEKEINNGAQIEERKRKEEEETKQRQLPLWYSQRKGKIWKER